MERADCGRPRNCESLWGQTDGDVAYVGDAAVELKRAAHHITTVGGGEGAVREVVEVILKTRGKWMKAIPPSWWATARTSPELDGRTRYLSNSCMNRQQK
jgi:hypothetical protein